MSLLGLTMMLVAQAAQNESVKSCQDMGYPSFFHLDRQSNQCYRIGEKGPCQGENMMFYAQGKDGIFGACDCDYWATCTRPLVYWKEYDSCLPLHSQGPCEYGEWLSYDQEKKTVTCQKNPCLPEQDIEQNFFSVWPDGKCYAEGQQGPCPPAFYLLINTGQTIPACRRAKLCLASWAPTIPCAPGHKAHLEGRCSENNEQVLDDPSDNSLCEHGSRWDSDLKECVL